MCRRQIHDTYDVLHGIVIMPHMQQGHRKPQITASSVSLPTLHYRYIHLHGLFMGLSWGVLLPMGVIIARYLRHKDPLWFKIHRACQVRCASVRCACCLSYARISYAHRHGAPRDSQLLESTSGQVRMLVHQKYRCPPYLRVQRLCRCGLI